MSVLSTELLDLSEEATASDASCSYGPVHGHWTAPSLFTHWQYCPYTLSLHDQASSLPKEVETLTSDLLRVV